MEFHLRLRELREGAGMTQAALAKLVGLSVGGLAHLEQGIRKPSLETAQKIASALGVTCEAFNEPVADAKPAAKSATKKGKRK